MLCSAIDMFAMFEKLLASWEGPPSMLCQSKLGSSLRFREQLELQAKFGGSQDGTTT